MNTQLFSSLSASLGSRLASGAHVKMSSLLAATLFISAPLASQAHADAAMDACVKAFVAVNLPGEQPVTIRKATSALSAFDTHGRSYEISVKATGATSGKNFGRATCLVDRNGEVVAVNGKSVADYLATVTAATAEQTAAR